MATKNFFDLLGDDENEDPSQVVVRMNTSSEEVKLAAGAAKKPIALAKMTTRPTPPTEAVKENQRGQYDGASGGRGAVRGVRGGRGSYGDRDGGLSREGGYKDRSSNNDRNASQARDVDGFVGSRSSIFERPVRTENGEGRSYDAGRGRSRGRGRGGRGYCEEEERPRRREFDRHSGNARGNELDKRAGAGRGNWGTEVDPTLILGTMEAIKHDDAPALEGGADLKPELETSADAAVEEHAAETIKEDKEEAEDNEMTLEEYEKVLEEKRRALEAEKTSERKVEVDKAFEKMQLVDNKKREEDIFIKLGQDKEKVKREAAEREEKARKPVSINEFLKPAEGEKYYGPASSRGRGGRGDRREGGGRGDRDSSRISLGGGRIGGTRTTVGVAFAPKIEDQAQFPTLGGK